LSLFLSSCIQDVHYIFGMFVFMVDEVSSVTAFLYYMLLFLSTPGMGWQFGFTWYGKTSAFARPRPEIWSPLCSHVELPKIVPNFIARYYW